MCCDAGSLPLFPSDKYEFFRPDVGANFKGPNFAGPTVRKGTQDCQFLHLSLKFLPFYDILIS